MHRKLKSKIFDKLFVELFKKYVYNTNANS